jgi:four helix bundle protein
MKIVKFEELIAWQKSQDFAVVIYQNFSGLKDYGFIDQIRRAAVSISNNIAEGFDRNSKADFIRFLYIAISSCSEVKSMLYLSQRLKYLEPIEANIIIEQANELSRIIRGLIKSLGK